MRKMNGDRVVVPSRADILLQLDDDYRVVDLRGEARDYSPKNAIGESFLGLVHPDDRETVRETISNDNSHDNLNFRLKPDEGADYRWFEFVHLKADREYGFNEGGPDLWGLRDITPRKEFEERLDGSQQRLWQVIDLIPNIIYARDDAGRYIFANEALADLYDVTPREVIEKRDSELDGFAMPQKCIDEDMEAIKSGTLKMKTETMPADDGEKRIVKTRRIPYRVAGTGKPAVLVILSDITDRVSTRQELDRQRQIDDLRAAVWKLSSRFSSSKSEGEVIQELLETIGPFLDVDNISFLRAYPDDGIARVEQVWKKEGVKSGERVELPLWIFDRNAGEPYFCASREDIPEEVRPIVEPIFSTFNTESTLALPYGNRDRPEGYLVASAADSDYEWAPAEINLLQEINEIIKVNMDRHEAEESLHYREKFENLIAEISARLVDAYGEAVDDEVDRALEEIGEFSDVDRAYLFMFRGDRQVMDNTNEWCAEGVAPEIDSLQGLPTEIFPWWMEKLKRRETIHVPRVSEMPPEASAEQEILERQDIKSVVVVPVISRNQIIGYMGFDSVKQRKEWDEDIIKLLQMVAEVFGSTLAREDIERKLEDLHGIAINLHRHRGESEICQEVVEAAEHVIDLSNSMIALREGNKLVPRASSSGVDPAQLKVLEIGEGIGGRTVEEGLPIWGNVADLVDGEELDLEYKSILSVPIGDLGNFQAVSEREDAFSKNDLRLTTLLASHIEDELLQRDYEKKLIDAKAQLEKSRKKYKQLVENQGEGIISIDNDWNVVFANPAAAEIVGFDSTEATIGQNVSKFLDQSQWEKVEGKMEERHRGENSSYELEIQRGKGGERRVILVTARPRVDDEGDVIGSFAIIRDITERVEAERELKELNERIREMTGMVAHELRTPLTTIRGYADMLKDGLIGEITEDQQDVLDKISRSSERLSDLVQNFLDLEKIEAGQFAMGQVQMKIDDLLTEVMAEANGQAEEKGLELRSSLEEDLTILGDRQRLYQAFSNLISNAIKFTPSGSIWIEAERGDDEVTVEVGDEGVGIHEEDLDKVFDKFYQAETSGIRTANGTGLGLTLVKKVVEAHGGSIDVTSTLGEGTTVTVHLPVS